MLKKLQQLEDTFVSVLFTSYWLTIYVEYLHYAYKCFVLFCYASLLQRVVL